MTGSDTALLLVAVVLAFLANDLWRWLGVVASDRIDEASPLFVWIRLVATALVAGLVAKFVVAPSGGLAQVPLWLRLAAVAIGLAAYAAGRRSLALGVGAGAATLVCGVAAFGY
ncbi:AzlD domain-containing protein [Chelatococcus sambhunathii]|uniref:AzlD domain-containing protein n=1 Tax=Chelatococcus sambhunathii TaxID=363953 RepID=A0ABU1DED6_9HYPH|nr:AzlD domain-containing protein [Chelatococcus sambhunathii]MDR4306437.1 AzlD domain-containing protein [Chelatococcus sambhunathii]